MLLSLSLTPHPGGSAGVLGAGPPLVGPSFPLISGESGDEEPKL